MSIEIIKSTGEKESFDKVKLCESIKHAGAPQDLADTVCSLVEKEVIPKKDAEIDIQDIVKGTLLEFYPTHIKVKTGNGLGLDPGIHFIEVKYSSFFAR